MATSSTQITSPNRQPKLIPKPPTVTVVIRNLPAGTTEQELLDLCYNCGGVAEVEIPTRVSLYTKFIFAFVRFVSFDAALTAVSKLDGLMVQRRRISVQLARSHWRNTNEKTVLYEETNNDTKQEENLENLSPEEISANIMQICQRQWQQHRKKNRGRDLPNFGKLMEMIVNATENSYDDDDCQEEASGHDV